MRIEYLDDSSDMKNDRQIVGYSFSRYVVTVDAKRALVGAGARILFYPTLLYNVCRNKIQAEFRWWDQIDQFLLLGAVPFPKDVHRLKQLGVCGVITLNEPFETLVPSSLYQGMQPAARPRMFTAKLVEVEFKHMTPASALEYVQSRRPRVLLAPSQWKVIQEYKQWRLASTATPSADAVLITKADLEGFHSPSQGNELTLVPRVVKASPMMARLSCLFASLKVSGSCTPINLKLTEAPAC